MGVVLAAMENHSVATRKLAFAIENHAVATAKLAFAVKEDRKGEDGKDRTPVA